MPFGIGTWHPPDVLASPAHPWEDVWRPEYLAWQPAEEVADDVYR